MNHLENNSGLQGWHSRGYLPHFDSPDHTQHITVHLADSLPKSAIERIDAQLECLPEEDRTVERRKRLHGWIDAGHGSCLLQHPECAKTVEDAFLFFDGQRYRLFAWAVMPNHFHVLFQPMNNWSMAKIVASWKGYTSKEIRKWLRARQQSGDPGIATLPRGTGSRNAEARQESGDPGSATLPRGTGSRNAEARQESGDPGSATLPRGTGSRNTEARQESGDPGIATLPRGTGSRNAEARQESGDPGSATLPRGTVPHVSVSAPNSDYLSGNQPIWPREYWDRYIRNQKHFAAAIDYIHNNPVKAGLCRLPSDWPFSSASKQ